MSPGALPKPLTAREREVLALLTQGLRNSAIAERLFISKYTLQHHLRAIYAKLGVSSRSQAILHALRSGHPETASLPRYHP